MTNKQTAVQWLAEQMMHPQNHNPYIEQALAMEREQIEDAYYDGQSLNAKSVTSQMIIDNSISYYNEIYKGGDK